MGYYRNKCIYEQYSSIWQVMKSILEFFWGVKDMLYLKCILILV